MSEKRNKFVVSTGLRTSTLCLISAGRKVTKPGKKIQTQTEALVNLNIMQKANSIINLFSDSDAILVSFLPQCISGDPGLSFFENLKSDM